MILVRDRRNSRLRSAAFAAVRGLHTGPAVEKVSPDQRFVFITGASTGIGRASALRLAGSRMRVLAGVRNDADSASIEHAGKTAAGPGGIQAIQIDVTDARSVLAASQQVGEIVGAAG